VTERTWPPPEVELNDLGHGVSWSRSVYGDESEWIGILEWHQCQDGEPGHLTAGGVYFKNAPEFLKGARWDLVQEDPLTLSPSILCKRCGLHGFIRAGRWVPA
jgi:hypothetical protein